MRKKTKLVFGVGINDAPFPVQPKPNGKAVADPVYLRWKSMIARCYDVRAQRSLPTYVGCSVDPEWHRFMSFREWYLDQPKQPGDHLDKDILYPGNRVYHPGLCVFVSPALNAFMNPMSAARGDFMIGCNWDKQMRKFRSQCSNPFTKKNECMGHFGTELAAHLAWKRRKHELACQWADQVEDPRLKQALRTRYAD